MEREQESKYITKIQIIKGKFASLSLLSQCPSLRSIVLALTSWSAAGAFK